MPQVTYNIYNNATGELIKSGATSETIGRQFGGTNTETEINTSYGTFEISQGAISFVFADTAEGVELILESGALTFDLNKSIGGSSNAELYVNMESGGGADMTYKISINGKIIPINGKTKGIFTLKEKDENGNVTKTTDYQWDNTSGGGGNS